MGSTSSSSSAPWTSSLPPLVLACMVPQEKVPAGRSSRLSLQHWSRALRSRPGPPPLSWRRPASAEHTRTCRKHLAADVTSDRTFLLLSLAEAATPRTPPPSGYLLLRPRRRLRRQEDDATLAYPALIRPAPAPREVQPLSCDKCVCASLSPLIYMPFFVLRSEGLSNKRVERP